MNHLIVEPLLGLQLEVDKLRITALSDNFITLLDGRRDHEIAVECSRMKLQRS